MRPDSPFPSRGDGTVYGTRGACATSHPLAAEAGLELLRRGGSAVDAAVAMAAALTVVEPTSNGIGGDAFALVWAEGKLHGLNGSGRSPRGMTLDRLKTQGLQAIPARGWWPVTVPGAPAAWRDLHRRFGKLEFSEVLEPAVRMAEDGHPVAPVVSHYWNRAAEVYRSLPGPVFEEWRRVFAPSGRGPQPGEVVRFPDHGGTLARIAASGAEDFYRGDLAVRMDAASREGGGFLRATDLAGHESAWVEPLGVDYRNVRLWELPPNGQGIVALSALGILEGLPPGESWDDPFGVHASIEAVKVAFADARAHVAEPRHMGFPPDALLESAYLRGRRELVGPRAMEPEAGTPVDGGTVYLAAADTHGMMVSYIQSNYMGFGSGVVVPGTGIALQNRGVGFDLDPGHPNVLAPEKKPFHTIIPGFLTREGMPWGPMGVMGGHMQPQGHVQMVRALVDFGLPAQTALDLPRWRWNEGLRMEVEGGFPQRTLDALRDWGHDAAVAADESPFGRGQVILREDGVLAAASDRRADGKPLVL